MATPCVKSAMTGNAGSSPAERSGEMTMIKHAFKAGIKAMPGIEF